METLANLTQTDINNGALIRMLANIGIPDVPEYVKNFHRETEDLIIDDFEHPDQNKVDNDEQIVPPADIRSWLAGLRPCMNDPVQVPLSVPQQKPEQPPPSIHNMVTYLRPVINDPAHVISIEQPSEPKQQQQQLPGDVHGWIAGLRPRFDDPIQPPVPEQQQQQPPTDLRSWMQRMAPDSSQPFIDTTSETINAANNNNTALEGNLGTWLYDWSKHLVEQPPPASLDNWLQGMIPKDMHEPIGKASNPKGRLNSYLNAAQEVLSKHGYKVSSEVKPPTNVKPKTGMFGNVKQMYFLWKILDKNNDRKITVEDVEIMLQEMGLSFLSKPAAQSLFEMVDSNHDGELQFRDFIALMGIIKQLIGAMGSAKA